MRNEQTVELIAEIERSPDLVNGCKLLREGKLQGTWVCKELVYAYAMWISARFHLQVIRAFDAIASQPQIAPSDVTLTAKQARFLQCAFSQFDELKRFIEQKH